MTSNSEYGTKCWDVILDAQIVQKLPILVWKVEDERDAEMLEPLAYKMLLNLKKKQFHCSPSPASQRKKISFLTSCVTQALQTPLNFTGVMLQKTFNDVISFVLFKISTINIRFHKTLKQLGKNTS